MTNEQEDNTKTQAVAETQQNPQTADSNDQQTLADNSEQAEPPNPEESPSVSEPVNSEMPKGKKRRGFFWLGLLVLLVLIALCTAVAFLGWQGYDFYQQDAAKLEKVEQLQQQLTNQSKEISVLKQAQQAALAASRSEQQQLQERLLAAEQRLLAQNKRLLSMSTITREDWLLAEAEYLLKLANQRILVERSAEGADALLSEADNILRDLDDPDLFALRKAINNDLAAVRLVKKIDREGLYLQINGLIEQIIALPIRPDRKQVLGTPALAPSDKIAEDSSAANWWEKLQQHFFGFINSLNNYISIDHHAEKPKPILAPESAQYLQQNVRLMLERAQLALLREQQLIYQQSLQQAEKYLADFYPNSEPVENFRGQLQLLAERNVVVNLPDITGSLELLHSYIEELHNLKGADKPASNGGQQG